MKITKITLTASFIYVSHSKGSMDDNDIYIYIIHVHTYIYMHISKAFFLCINGQLHPNYSWIQMIMGILRMDFLWRSMTTG